MWKKKKILKDLEGKMSTIYTQAIFYIEFQQRSKELEEIKKISTNYKQVLASIKPKTKWQKL